MPLTIDDEAVECADALCLQILPRAAGLEFLTSGTVTVETARYRYRLSRFTQTQILTRWGQHVAWACLQLTTPAPAADRMIAEYLVLRNDEDCYWETANIFRAGWRHYVAGTLIGLGLGAIITLLLFGLVRTLVGMWVK